MAKNKNYLHILVLIVLVFSIVLFLTPEIQDYKINKELKGLTLSEMIISMGNAYYESGESQSITTKSNLTIKIIPKINYTEEGVTPLGTYNFITNTIEISADTIKDIVIDRNFTESDLYLRIENTLSHELGHYILEEDVINDVYGSYNITIDSNNGYLRNSIIYINAGRELKEDIPISLQSTIDFESLYPYYDKSEWAEETFVRLHALCWRVNPDYKYYWEMYEPQDYAICNKFLNVRDYPNYDNNIDAIAKEISDAYYSKYRGELK